MRILEFALDLDRYCRFEPRLIAAYWLDGPVAPAVGARAYVVADVPFTIRLLRPLIGPPSGTATITGWAPGEGLRCELDASAFTGFLEVRDATGEGIHAVAIRGEILFRSRAAQLVTRPFRSQMETLATRSIERALERASDAFAGAASN